MQVLKQHKYIVLIVILLVAITLVSLFIIQYPSKPSLTPTPSPSATLASPTPSQTSTPTPTPSSTLYLGEVTQYQGQGLAPISLYIEEVIQHPDVSIHGTQNLNQSTYRLAVSGLVNQPESYTYEDVVNGFQSYQQVSTLLCVEGWGVRMLWQGVRVSDLIQKAGVSPNATTLIFSASDGYTTAVPLDYINQNNIILAYKMNNVTLPAVAGWPFMLIAQNQYGYKWIKWITGIEVSNNSGYLGYWESRGYPNNATIS